MQIDIQAQGGHADAELEHFVGSRVNFALGRLRERVGAVEVSLSPARRADGEAARRCRVRVSLTGTTDLEVENVDPNIYIAIHRAVDRAGWEVARRFERERRRARVSRITGLPPVERHEPDRAA